MIELQGVHKQYGKYEAVRDLSLTVRRGELFGFIGPNGAGKTTTIRIISGLLAPTRGRVLIDGIDMALEPTRAKRRIGLIPDRPFLYEKLTGMEYMRFIADLYGVRMGRSDGRAIELLEMFRLSDRAHELIESYSHGMKQRLVMASALLHAPPVVVVDEPMVGLDPEGIKMVRDLFRRLAKEGTTLFMSTHTLSLAEDVCDRIGIIHTGSLVATGRLDELRAMARVPGGGLESAFLALTRETRTP
jgi:ABC-2 type transport system ATP-binding protein